MFRFISLKLSILTLFTLAIIPCFAQDNPKNNPTSGINDPNISVFIEAMHIAGLNDVFEGTGPFTAFVPSNNAFAKMDKYKWEELQKPEMRDQLTNFLLHHIAQGKYMLKHLKKTTTIKPMSGRTLKVSSKDGSVFVDESKITRSDLVGPNGVVHEIDQVLESSKN